MSACWFEFWSEFMCGPKKNPSRKLFVVFLLSLPLLFCDRGIATEFYAKIKLYTFTITLIIKNKHSDERLREIVTRFSASS